MYAVIKFPRHRAVGTKLANKIIGAAGEVSRLVNLITVPRPRAPHPALHPYLHPIALDLPILTITAADLSSNHHDHCNVDLELITSFCQEDVSVYKI